MSEHEEAMLQCVRKFDLYDLDSKGAEKPNLKEILPYYQDMIAEFIPDKIDW
jgi:inositol oxygenase